MNIKKSFVKAMCAVLAFVMIMSAFTGCSISKSAKPIEASMTTAIELSMLKYDKNSDINCAVCNSNENVCTIHLYESEIGVGNYDTVGICKACSSQECTYCANEPAKYLCFSLLGLPLFLCESDIEQLMNQ
ncbi:hypothetical protein [Eubacterium sp.]|uniref:hypothetical protein n=1 Tax=Eubacterium sp. TaxID=142586 RepID=UPI003F010079